MKIKLYITCILLFATVLITGCTKENNERIPITTNSEKALEYFNTGLELSQNIRGQEAVYYYLKAIGEDNDFAMAYVQLAMVQSTPKLVFKYLNKAKSLIENVSEGEALSILAIEAGLNNEREKQNNYYLELIELYPNDANLHNVYGGLLYGMPNYKTAIKHLKRAIELDPELSQPYNMLGYSYRQLGDFEKAEYYFKQYIALISDQPNPYDSYAELLLKKGEFEKSIEYYRKALEIKPNFIASIIGIATNLTLMDKQEEACDTLAGIEDVTSDPGDLRRMHLAKAVVNVDYRNFERAVQELEANISISKGIEDDVSLGNDLINLATLHLMKGNHDKALKYYEKSMEYYERSNISQDLKYYLRRQLFANGARVAYFKNDVETIKKYKQKYEYSADKTLNLNEIRNIHELGGHISILEGDFENAIYEYNQANLENPIILYLIGTAYEELGDYKRSKKYYDTVAHFNSYNDMNYAFIRKTALDKLTEY